MSGVVFLDACVLYPRAIRRLVLGAAAAGLCRPAWSLGVLDEWRHAARRDGGAVAEAAVEAEIVLMAARHPGALVAAGPVAGLDLPDLGDLHVLAGAIAAGAETLITLNLRDFPARRLAAFRMVPRHPDSWLWEAFSAAPAAMTPVIAATLAEMGAQGAAGLRRARLPRLARAWSHAAPQDVTSLTR